MDRPDNLKDGPQAFDLADFLPYRLNVAAARVSREFAKLYAEFGLSIPEWRILAHLWREDGVSVREIARRAEMDKSKVSRATDRLIAAGWISRQAADEDRRLVVLALTAEGRGRMVEILPRANAFQANLQARLGPLAAPFSKALGTLTEPLPDAD